MGLKAPGYISMSPAQSFEVADPVPANAAFPGSIDAMHHSLATAGHHYGGAVGVVLTAGTHTMILPVPPSVVYVQVTVMMQGNGTVTIDSTSNGTAKTWTVAGKVNNIGAAFPLKTSGLPGDSITSPLKVRSSAAWTWVTETVTVTLSGGGSVLGLCFDPIWEAQSV